MSIEVNNETDVELDQAELVAFARFVLERLHVNPAAELSIVLIDEPAMAKLHVEWMDLEGPTDVMSFPLDEITPGEPGRVSEAGLLGDVVICPQVAGAQAETAGHTMREEILLLLTHGILHLLGYDHAEEEEKAEMFGLQRELLGAYLGHAPKETIE